MNKLNHLGVFIHAGQRQGTQIWGFERGKVPKSGCQEAQNTPFAAQNMASNSQQPKGRAGKTVAPKGRLPSPSTSSSDTDSDNDSKQSKPDPAPEGATQTQSQDKFHAAPPAKEDSEEYDPEKVSIKDVQQYTVEGLQLVPVTYLRWDEKQVWGQIRTLDQDLVQRYVKSVEKEPPRLPVRVLLRNMGSDMLL